MTVGRPATSQFQGFHQQGYVFGVVCLSVSRIVPNLPNQGVAVKLWSGSESQGRYTNQVTISLK